MTDDLEFSITENTLEKILAMRKKMGFEKKSWDDWFNHIFSFDTTKKQDKIEEIMKNIQYERSYEDWVKNFGLNLHNIWNESSARDLDPSSNLLLDDMKNKTAIVIGRGPSLKKQNHLKLLADSNYDGNIVCCDGILIEALKAGITPDRFPNYFVVTIDPAKVIRKYYDDEIVDKYGINIKGIFSTVSNPLTVERARNAKIKIHWVHALFDYNEGKKSFNQISALMVRAKNHSEGLPAIQTGGNVGTASWFISWLILKCSTIALIGINHGWNEEDSWETIISHGGSVKKLAVDTENPSFKKLYPIIYNPDFNCKCILDPIFQYYRKGLIEFIERSPSWVSTINATEGGSIFGSRIRCMALKEFLQNKIN